MREIGTSGLMSGGWKRGDANTAKPPRLSSTLPLVSASGLRISESCFARTTFRDSRTAPMPTECSAERFDFGVVEGRAVDAAFDAGLVTSDAGALLLGATDRAIDLVSRFADCFRDYRCQELIEHEVATLVGQRMFAIALGY